MIAASSLEALRVNPDWASLPLFDRSGWTRLPFGAFADSINERVEPSEAADEPYVGLDDLDPGSLHIRRWGKGSDVIGTKLRFRKGDIIFGRRRAYQRKIAVAEFDGICSAHAMVVRAKREIVLPEFLPFLMMSDRFMKRAVEISVGSLSPTINWSALKVEEFDLPPLDHQRDLAAILSAGQNLRLAVDHVRERSQTARQTLLMDAFRRLAIGAPERRLIDIGYVQLGRQRAPQFTKGVCPRPYLRVVNVLDGQLDLRDIETMDFDDNAFERYRLRPGDILVTEGDLISPDNVGRSAIYRGEIQDCCFQKTLLRFRAGDALMPEYAHAAMQYLFYSRVFAKVAVTTTVSHLTAERFERILIPVPDRFAQEKLCRELEDFGSWQDVEKRHRESTSAAWAELVRTLEP